MFVLILLLPGGVLGSLRIEFTLRGVYIAQTLLALPIVQSAVRALRDVATFDSAGVTEK